MQRYNNESGEREETNELLHTNKKCHYAIEITICARIRQRLFGFYLEEAHRWHPKPPPADCHNPSIEVRWSAASLYTFQSLLSTPRIATRKRCSKQEVRLR